MLSKIKDIVFSTKNVPVRIKNQTKLLPLKGSLVEMKVLDKIGNNHKLLINGSVFQAKLPVNFEIGEELFGKVQHHQPLTLVIDDLLSAKQLTPQMLSTLIAKMDLKNISQTKDIISKLLGAKKPLAKSKIKRLLEFIELNDLKNNDLLYGLIIQMIWSSGNDNYNEMRENYNSLFDQTYEELVQAIFESVKAINSTSQNNLLTETVNKYLVFDFEKFAGNPNFTIPEKKILHELILFLENHIRTTSLINPGELENLLKLLVKYTLQISVYNYYGLFPDFVILKNKNAYQAVTYRFEKKAAQDGTLSFQIFYSPEETKEFAFRGIYTVHKIYGELIIEKANLQKYTRLTKDLNDKIEKELDIQSTIYPALRSTTERKSGMIFGETKSVNYKI